MKTVEFRLPEWVNWIAQDADGEIWLFSEEPKDVGLPGSDIKNYFNAPNDDSRVSLLSGVYYAGFDIKCDLIKIDLNNDTCHVDSDGILVKG